MKIAFDVDGVVLNSIDVILDHINMNKGTNLTASDLFSWGLENFGIDRETIWESIYHMYRQPDIEPYAGAVEALSEIHAATGEPLLFITGRSEPDSARRQLERLPWNASVPEIVVTGGDRYKMPYFRETSADFIIEDDIEHLTEYLDSGIGVGIMLRPWNVSAEIPGANRFQSWEELRRWFFEASNGSRATEFRI